MSKHRPREMETVVTDWSDMILVCRSCGDSGFGPEGEDGLRRVLKRSLREAGRRREIGIVEVDCLGICPKHAVTVGLASRPQRLLVVPEGEEGAAVLARLGVPLAG